MNDQTIETWRRELHMHPEISGNEIKTAARIEMHLKASQPVEVCRNLGGHGLLAVYGNTKADKCLMIRCELDALPIQEVNDFEHKSTVNGMSHKCGHDGHMSILLSLAYKLKNLDLRQKKIVLLFQPSEENGEGAKAVLEEEAFEKIKPNYVLALHNVPGFPKSSIVCKAGNFTPAVISLICELEGKTAHAGEPENGINPALAVSEIIQMADELNCSDKDEDWAVITPIHIEMGEVAYGISAGKAILRYTLRCHTNQKMKALYGQMEKGMNRIAKKHGLECKISDTQYFAANENDEPMVKLIKEAAETNELEYIEKAGPFSWGEDFGLFSSRYKGAMFGLGAGIHHPSLHNPDYDYPDEITPAGRLVFEYIVEHFEKLP